MADTIFALATAPGRAAVAVLRLSGPGVAAALAALTGRARAAPRHATLRTLRRPAGGVLDQALTIWFPGPHSYTGEDAAELHLHGGSAVVDGVVEALAQLGLRPAEPGEFTRRAFERGKLDLAQAEAVADLVDAETGAQRTQALAQLDGELGRRHAAWREALAEAQAVLEAAVDFPDEDLPEAVATEAAPIVGRLIAEIEAALDDAGRGERVREGFRIAIIGAPNAGKSSLLNALAGRPAAIVTATAGTTRDVIETPIDLAGYRVLLADTAGLRETNDPIEAEGVRRALAWGRSAALRLLVVDGSSAEAGWRQAAAEAQPGDVCVLSKRDLGPGSAAAAARAWAETRRLAVVDLSLISGTEVGSLRQTLSARVAAALSGAEFPAATRERHRRDLTQAQAHLARARDALAGATAVELAAEDVRLASRSLARISGRIDAEEVLGRVFARFCIGK
jgi:tRNA modification GTPase